MIARRIAILHTSPAVILDVNVVGRDELAHRAMVVESGSKCRDSGMGTIALIAENQCHGVARRNVADVCGFRNVLADTTEGDARQELRMPHGLAPLFGRRHFDGYGFLGVDIDMDVPGLLTRLENSARVVISRVQTGTFIV